MPKTVEGELDIPPPQGWLPPISRPTLEKNHTISRRVWSIKSICLRDKVVSSIPECVNEIVNKKKVVTVLGMQNPEPSTSISRKSTSLVPKRKTTTTPKASTIPKSWASKKSSNSPPLPPPSKSSSTNTLITRSVQVHVLPMITRSAARNANPPLLTQAPANVAMQNYMRQKTRSVKKAVGELSAKAKSVTNRLTTPKITCKKGEKK